jgi:5-(carboxyamino)imidazole ribonucleotide mutase
MTNPLFLHEVPVNLPGALVGVVMGSQSDWPTMRKAAEMLDKLEIPWERRIISAHRTPQRMFDYAHTAEGRGLKVIIAGAGGAAHLPGMLSGSTLLPVHGVPVQSKALSGVDSLYSIVQMPAGVPTATFSIGDSGAVNAALQAARMLATSDRALRGRLEAFVIDQRDKVALVPVDQA